MNNILETDDQLLGYGELILSGEGKREDRTT